VAQSVQRLDYRLDSRGSIVGRDMASVAFRLTLGPIQTCTQARLAISPEARREGRQAPH
jgi:hypothetical protein